MNEQECQQIIDANPKLAQELAKAREPEGFAGAGSPFAKIGDGTILRLLIKYGPKILAMILALMDEFEKDEEPNPMA